MPIYAYRCESCGFQKDVLRKMSDPPLTDCPSCGKATFQKQVTAAGFQLKGSGWYVTDFRDNGNKSSGTGAASDGAAEGAAATGGDAKSGSSGDTSGSAAAVPAPPAAPAGGSGASPAAPTSSAA
ncbi:FmdB family transcriptional regulator [Robbsia andropogonis]|uniref:FmdB family transcriptional regulator n=1 Tax=Robbsia andropogonis TaxID=28092 RepID=A0A0F5K521_9BURK|nr:FmdB family zinc ribbon protein [Robbsia andropogonis]KKB65193.1 FmdB family transcriptional regulator [Robbsia andropogonis]MCP1117076.1 zinc ribbon domain-containing protein [Robbsia andropogonis]MCP1128423.1 zinc ribbon domain-containing protein [Robbsia andropogonis]